MTEEGETYHIAHLPLAYADRSETGKTTWEETALDHLLRPRLAAAGETTWEGPFFSRTLSGPDRRAQLSGCILLAFDAKALAPRRVRPATGDRPQAEVPWLSLDATNAMFVWNCSCSDTQFSGVAGFVSAQFSGVAWFESAQFSGVAWFESAQFSGVAWFESAQFSGDARFVSAQFSGVAWFQDAGFQRSAYFDCRFQSAARFVRVLFGEIAWFNGAAFEGEMAFTAAVFQRLASFKQIQWPESAQHWHGAFNQALFHGTLNITKSGFRAFAAFDGATLERGIQIDEEDETKAKAAFKAERQGAIDAAAADGEAFEAQENETRKKRDEEKAVLVSRRELRAHIKDQREVRLRELERGCRVLKQAMERASDKRREQLLYSFELRARRAQRALPAGEKFFAFWYAHLSDYGASMVRPFLALLVLIVLFTGYFQVRAYGSDPSGLVPSLEFSASRVFPFGAFEDVSKEHIKRFASGLFRLELRVLGSIQSALAIVLVFLFGLAVRRRFQIN